MAFVICKDNTGYAVSLERHKVYKTVRDASAARHGLLRVVDESGEGYLYPATMFEKMSERVWVGGSATAGRTMAKSGTMPRKRSRKRARTKPKKEVA